MLRLDLEALRARLRPIFVDYERAVTNRNSGQASSFKSKITKLAFAELRGVVPHDARGIYFFVSANQKRPTYHYVGVASSGTLRRRMESRFRHENCFDEWPSDAAREDIWAKTYKRICVSMHSRPEKKLDYAYQHTKAALLFRNSTEIWFFPTTADPAEIKSAESLLIYAGASMGAALFNIQERDKLSTDLKLGSELAFSVMEQLPDAECWIDSSRSILGRFDGDCC